MSSRAAYDAIADQYASLVRASLIDETSVLSLATQTLLRTLGDISDLDICDLACGEGHLSARLAQFAHSVVGLDLSAELIKLAQDQRQADNLKFVIDDAQSLATQTELSFDRVISNFALMDIPDLSAVYRSVYRVLRPSGHFVFSITHPCFQAPHTSIQTDETGHFVARQIPVYAQEGFWRSENSKGIRGQVGAFHRMISTYINLATETGFTVITLNEPTLVPKNYSQPHIAAQVEIPSVMIVSLKK